MTTHFDVQKISETLHAGRLSDAEQLCRTCLQGDPDNEGVLLLLAVSQHWQSHFDDAAATYAHLLKQVPASSIYWNNYGVVLHANHAYTEARAAFAKAIELDPANAAPHIGLGLLRLDLREPTAARDALLEAVRLDPNLPLARIHAARACNLCRDNAAEGLLQGWETWLPLDDGLQLVLAYEKLTLGDARASLQLLEELHGRTPDSAEVSLQLASVYERMNRNEEAKTLLAQVERMPMPEPRTLLEIAHQRATLALRDGDLAPARRN